MNPEDKKEAIQRYEERLAQFGQSMKALGWRDAEQQSLRFKILAQVGELQGTKILDVGCGFGDFYGYLQDCGVKVDFTGYDISPKFIEIAKEKYPRATFEVRDILTDPTSEKFDYVFSSGIFNHVMAENMPYVHDMIRRMYDMSKIGTASNMMSNRVDFMESYLFYYSPEELITFSKTLARHFTMRHEYGLYEFSLYLYHEARKS